MMRISWLFCVLSLAIVSTPVCISLSFAVSDWEWSGHLRGSIVLDHYSEEHLLALTSGKQWLANGTADGRLNSTFYLGERTNFNLAYELVASGGETWETLQDIEEQNPALQETALLQNRIPTDENQLFSLTKVLSEGDDHVVYHRLDRIFIGYDSTIGNFSIGRQALTWGNGLLFNPADLVNPFAPSDIIRDYKIGSDMILYQTGFESLTDLQLVIVPRRGEDDELDYEQSTLGMKASLSAEIGDFDFYLTKNYQDPVLGLGFSTFLADGVVRSDITWTYLEEHTEEQNYFSAVLNYDRSWNWLDKNWYGFIEFYYNGLGESDPLEALQKESLRARLGRGEVFVTGTYYADALLQYEAHPLVNIFATLIYNLEDHSFLFQPRLSWDISQSAELLMGVNIPVGSLGSEFGELENPEDKVELGRPTQVYLVATFFF